LKTVIIIGAGPAGLTAGYELLKQSKDYKVIILEESDMVGGISRTVNHNGNRMDIGGHRFFSKDESVMKWWLNILPLQGSPSFDDELLNRPSKLSNDGPNPSKEDRVFLNRRRISRIYYLNKFFDYPISMKMQTILNLGFVKTIIAGFSYLKSCVIKKEDSNLENFYINRFGKKLYQLFFEGYTEKVWGRHPREISADWGAQRVKGLSIVAIIKDIFGKLIPSSNRKVETSLIEEFYYPKFGPGHLWETVCDDIIKMGGEVLFNSKVDNIKIVNNRIVSVSANNIEYEGSYFISSMPIKDLMNSIQEKPSNELLEISKNLPYRDFITIGVLVNKLSLKNETDIKTINNIVPDCWIYIQDTKVKLGRIQIFNNWSPYMVKDIMNTVWIGLEYFCAENDDFWNLSDEEAKEFAYNELVRIGVIHENEPILDSHREKIKKAYPAYFDSYHQIDKVITYLNDIDNLYCVGRNGQHRYNNSDHSMVTSFETVKNILNNVQDKSNIWNVNTEKEYHEKKTN